MPHGHLIVSPQDTWVILLTNAADIRISKCSMVPTKLSVNFGWKIVKTIIISLFLSVTNFVGKRIKAQ